MVSAKNRKKNSRKKAVKAQVSNEVRDYSNDPTVLKRLEEAKKFMEEHPFPEELLKILNERSKKK
jgi:hypothetical protein